MGKCGTMNLRATTQTGGVLFLNAVAQKPNTLVVTGPYVGPYPKCRLLSLVAPMIARVRFSTGAFCFMTKRTPLNDRKLKDDMFTQGMLWCSKCRQFFPVKDFGPTSVDSRNYGYRGHCLRCEAQRRENSKEAQSLYCKKRNNELKAKIVKLAGGACQKCGYRDYQAALDFHHIYRANKKYNVMTVIYSANLEKIWKEADKCCLLCSICHQSYKAKEWQAEFIKRAGLGWTVGPALSLDDSRYETDKPSKYQQSTMPLFYVQQVSQMALFDSRPTYTV